MHLDCAPIGLVRGEIDTVLRLRMEVRVEAVPLETYTVLATPATKDLDAMPVLATVGHASRIETVNKFAKQLGLILAELGMNVLLLRLHQTLASLLQIRMEVRRVGQTAIVFLVSVKTVLDLATQRHVLHRQESHVDTTWMWVLAITFIVLEEVADTLVRMRVTRLHPFVFSKLRPTHREPLHKELALPPLVF